MSNRPTIPHQLSYSSVSNANYSRWQSNERNVIKQSNAYQNNRSYQNENSDLAFLRNTVGHSSSSQLNKQFSKVNVPSYQPLLRQTSSNFNDFKNNKTPQNNNFYREKRSQTNYQSRQANQNKQTLDQFKNQGKDRLDKIIKKYDKKNQTIEALKLIQELKQLKKKQEELKKQRKSDYQKEQQIVSIKVYEPSSPLNFSKKNKVFTQNITSYEKCQPSTSASSPQNQSMFIKSGDIFNISSNFSKLQSSSYIKKQLQPISSNRKYNRTSIQVRNETDFNKTLAETKSSYTSPHLYNTVSNNSYASSNTAYSPKLTGNYQLDTKTAVYSTNQQDTYKIRDKSPISPYVSKKSYDSPVSNLQKSLHSPRLMVNTKQARDKSPNTKLLGSSSSSYTTNTKTTGLSGSQISNGLSSNQNITNGLSSSQISSTKSKNDLASSLIKRNVPDMTSSRSIKDKKYTISDFTLGKNLGEGKFGTVFQAMQKKSKALYALKKVPKSIIKSHYMIDQFILQIKIQSFLNHQNILTLNTTFDDSQNVYIMLQYMQQGTLFSHLKKSQKLSQSQASKKLRQISSAVQYLHQNGIAHRDIKPQNIVMSHGISKLCDFGWATICDQRRKTYCGTFDYAAPEILQGTQYDMSVDLWCLGILAYEILVGKAPFYHISRKETMKKIMNCEHQKINYPSNMSKQARSFIQQLLRKNPEQRLKSQDLLKHPFLKNVEK